MKNDRRISWVHADTQEWIEKYLNTDGTIYQELKKGFCQNCFASGITPDTPFIDEDLGHIGLLFYGCYQCDSEDINCLSIPASQETIDEIKKEYKYVPLEVYVLSADLARALHSHHSSLPRQD